MSRTDRSSVEEHHRAQGKVSVVLRDRSGVIVDKRLANNVIVTGGRTLVANLFIGGEENSVSHIAVGEGTTPPTEGDVALESEVEGGRKTLVSNIEGTTAVLTVNFDFDEALGTLSEAGVFNAEAEDDSVMYSRVVFDPISKTSNFTLTLKWSVTF